MSVCWAEFLGDCDEGGLSREHVVSHGIFPKAEVFVEGFEWCLDAPKQIAHANFVKRCLCVRHNNGLSEVDAAGIEIMNELREAYRLYYVRAALKPRRWQVQRVSISGRLLERWLLKTLINTAYGRGIPIGRGGSVPGLPSSDLVDIVFGRKTFEGKAGQYSLYSPQIDVDDRIRIRTFSRKKEEYFVGATFALHGFQFLLYLDNEQPPEDMSFLNPNGGTAELKTLNRHTAKLIVNAPEKHPSTIITIDWGQPLSFQE
jgi:hypothetical protein